MPGGSSVQHIDDVDALARNLYVRAKHSGLAFSDAASAVRRLHLALRHLRVEAADQDSLLNPRSLSLSRSPSSSYGSSPPACVRHLAPVVDGCRDSLTQLERVLDAYGDGRPSGEERARDQRLAAVGQRLAADGANVDMLLDAVQLHNRPSTARLDDDQPRFEPIKDKVDDVARRLFDRHRHCNDSSSLSGSDQDDLWLEFKAELEKEGFAPDVLRKHKDILRAYIREMESVGHTSDGSCPTVRRLLERERAQPTSPRAIPGGVDNNDKFFVGVRDDAGRLPDTSQAKQVVAFSTSPQESSFPADLGDSTALISTNDLVALDRLSSDMAGLSVQQQQQYGLSPVQRHHLPSHVVGSLPDPSFSSSPRTIPTGSSPRSLPPMAPYPATTKPLPPYGTSPRTVSRLAPDRYGHEIPPGAQWTKIRRALVSPEVLERAGVRYEARPEYVAVLGRLSRDQIADFARQSADARAARRSSAASSSSSSRPVPIPRRSPPAPRASRSRSRADSKSSQDFNSSAASDTSDTSDSEPDYSDDDNDNDTKGNDDDEKGTKSYPFIVNPPGKNKTSPASTVLPKPILKNRNENRVRFDPEPHELQPASRRDRERRHRERSPSPVRRRHRDQGGSSGGSSSRRRYSESSGGGGERYRDRERDREYYSSSGRRHRRGERRGSRRDQRDRPSKKAWGETLGAVGIGGAAAGLLSVLAEAAG